VRGRAHQPAVEVARADQPVEHLRADHPGIQHVGALGHHPLAIARGELTGGQPHVSPKPDTQLTGLLARKRPEHARERPSHVVRHAAADLLAIQPPDVIRLEDVRGQRAEIRHPGCLGDRWGRVSVHVDERHAALLAHPGR
jgi:hypothetical protein